MHPPESIINQLVTEGQGDRASPCAASRPLLPLPCRREKDTELRGETPGYMTCVVFVSTKSGQQYIES